MNTDTAFPNRFIRGGPDSHVNITVSGGNQDPSHEQIRTAQYSTPNYRVFLQSVISCAYI